MGDKLRRRDVMKAAAATGGLLLLGSAAPAQAERGSKLAGEWLNEGKLDQPCAIFAQGRVLLVVNERGELATGRVTEAGKLVILKGAGWDEGLVGELADDGKTLAWKGGGAWKRL
jgi:hypothetical protein